MGSLKAGAASKVINCEVGDALAGQLRPRISRRIRDDLEANVFYIAEEAVKILIVNCDLVSLGREYVDEVSALIGDRTGVPAENVIISCTHTHSGPYTKDSVRHKADIKYLDKLKERLVDASGEAVEGAVPAKLGWASGRAHAGHNRRVCWADGTHSMYGDASRPDFAGIEGPEDDSHAVLFASDGQGGIIGLLQNNACHPTCVGSSDFVSADYPGYARALIRDAIGENIPVLYLQGACGDLCRFSPKTSQPAGERRLMEIGGLLAAETLRLIAQAPRREEAALRHMYREITVGVRLPSAEMVRQAEKTVEKGPSESETTKDIAGGYGFQKGILRLYEEYKDNPRENVPLHALRVGSFALATVPCEYYCQFGLDIKLRSPAEVTAVSELTHGGLGYCPTIYGILGGGYSGATYYGCRLEPFAGYMMAEELSRMLYELFKA